MHVLLIFLKERYNIFPGVPPHHYLQQAIPNTQSTYESTNRMLREHKLVVATTAQGLNTVIKTTNVDRGNAAVPASSKHTSVLLATHYSTTSQQQTSQQHLVPQQANNAVIVPTPQHAAPTMFGEASPTSYSVMNVNTGTVVPRDGRSAFREKSKWSENKSQKQSGRRSSDQASTGRKRSSSSTTTLSARSTPRENSPTIEATVNGNNNF